MTAAIELFTRVKGLRKLLPASWRESLRRRMGDRVPRSFLPDRIFLERHILPWLVKPDGGTILSVGVAEYTAHYEGLVRKLGGVLHTADIDPNVAQFGAQSHVVRSVTELRASDFPSPPAAILFNGVIGFGLDDERDIEKAFETLAGLLSAEGKLVVGWNTDRTADPIATTAAVHRFFDRCSGPTGRMHITFTGSTHTYDFLRRKATDGMS